MNVTVKRIKNNTTNTITVRGVELPAGEEYTIKASQFLQWITYDDVVDLIADGTLLVGNESVFFTDVNMGLAWYGYTGEALKTHFQNDTFRSNEIYSTNVQEAIEEIKNNNHFLPEGKLIKVDFLYKNNSRNRWLQLDDGINSDQTPFVCPYNLRLITMTCSSRYKNSDYRVQLYCAVSGDDGDDAIQKMEQYISNGRASVHQYPYPSSSQAVENSLHYACGDKLGVYVKDDGTDPYMLFVSLYFIVIGNRLNITDDYNDYLNHSDSGGWFWPPFM